MGKNRNKIGKRIIWSNVDWNIDDYKKDLLDNCDEEDREHFSTLTDNQIYERMMYDAYEDLVLTKDGLDVNIGYPILIIASLGLWNGRKKGYKIIESGNIKDIFDFDADSVEWYGDRYNVRATAYHHDGTNYYTYKVLIDAREAQGLLDDIYYQREISPSKIHRYTRSLLPYIKKIYGW
jgi:hypothetical protein